jgi:regulator of sigma E protease
MVAKVYENSPAAKAGIQANDLVLKADGKDLVSIGSLGDIIRAAPGQAVTLTIDRHGKMIEVPVKATLPDEDKRAEADKQPLIGVIWDVDGKRTLVYPGVWEQVSDSVRHMKNLIAKLFSPKSDLSPAHMSGPVGIFRLYYTLFEHPDGWRMVLWFSVVFNINLAIMNLLPFPVLDGGHITMAIGEMIRRRPLQGRVLEAVQTACALLLFGFIFFVTLKDAGDLFGGGSGRGGKESGGPLIRWLPEGEKPATAK